jgi:hypothetical protein
MEEYNVRLSAAQLKYIEHLVTIAVIDAAEKGNVWPTPEDRDLNLGVVFAIGEAKGLDLTASKEEITHNRRARKLLDF